jgi:putative ABC transport system permease protein
MALTFPAAAYFRDALGQYFPVFNVDVRTLYLDLAAVAVVGTVAAGFPIWQAVKVPIAEGLRRIG